MPRLALFVFAAAFSVAIAQVIDSRLRFSSSRPSCAMPLPQDLCGFSIEPDRWPEWAGNTSHRNDFTYTMLSTLKEKTGVAPTIR